MMHYDLYSDQAAAADDKKKQKQKKVKSEEHRILSNTLLVKVMRGNSGTARAVCYCSGVTPACRGWALASTVLYLHSTFRVVCVELVSIGLQFMLSRTSLSRGRGCCLKQEIGSSYGPSYCKLERQSEDLLFSQPRDFFGKRNRGRLCAGFDFFPSRTRQRTHIKRLESRKPFFAPLRYEVEKGCVYWRAQHAFSDPLLLWALVASSSSSSSWAKQQQQQGNDAAYGWATIYHRAHANCGLQYEAVWR